MRKIGVFCLLFFVLSVPVIFASDIYDLCYHTEPLNYGKLFFTRYRNPLLDPVLRTYELYLFDPVTGTLSSLQKPNEQLYIPPIISPDKTTLCYHSLIEGTDFLTTKNIEIGKSIKLRFDTGGYFVIIGIDYDNDRVAAAVKRGVNQQAIYLISSRASTIKRLFTGQNFSEVGFLYNGNIYYVDTVEGQRILGIVYEKTENNYVIARRVDYVKRTPNGNAIIYSRGKELLLFRAQGRGGIRISENFDHLRYPPLYSSDGSTFAVFEESIIYIVNIPSGDIFYYLSIDTENTESFLTNFTFYIAKENKLFHLKHKQPGQSLTELFGDEKGIHLLAASPNDRYIVYQNEIPNEIVIYDIKESKYYRKEFDFSIQKVIYTAQGEQFYIIGLSQQKDLPVRELYLYNFQKESISPISTSLNVEVGPYRRKNNLSP